MPIVTGRGMEEAKCWITGKDGRKHHRRVHCYMGQEEVSNLLHTEWVRTRDYSKSILNSTDLVSKSTSLGWYNDEVVTPGEEYEDGDEEVGEQSLRRSKREKEPIRESLLGLAKRLESGESTNPIFKIREHGDVNNAELLRIIEALGVNKTVHVAYLQNPNPTSRPLGCTPPPSVPPFSASGRGAARFLASHGH